jgi:HK97 gp10 family phage protein
LEVSCDVQGMAEFQAAMLKFDVVMQNRVHIALVGWATDVKAAAMAKVPVKSGYLQSTIYAQVSDWVGEIGAYAAYAYFVELGTRYMRARPYLFPAFQEYLLVLEEIIGAAIEAAKAEAGL